MKNITLVFVLILFSACGMPLESRRSRETFIPVSQDEVNTIKSRQDFSCESLSGGQCPAGVGRVIVLNTQNKVKTKTCSAFLVSKTKVITNNHCVSTQKECQNSIIGIYNGYSSSVVGCKKILTTKVDSYHLDYRSVDFTVMEIDQAVNSDVLPLAARSARPGEKLTLWAIDQLNVVQARITELNCVFSRKNYSMELQGCPAISGNSGSPILNSLGEVVGIVWGGTEKNNLNASTELNARRSGDDLTVATDVAYFRDHL